MSTSFRWAIALALTAAMAFAGCTADTQPVAEYEPQLYEPLAEVYTASPEIVELKEQPEYELDEEIADEDLTDEEPEDQPAEEEEEAPPAPAPAQAAPPQPAAPPAQPATQAAAAPQAAQTPSAANEDGEARVLGEIVPVDTAAFAAEVIRVVNIERTVAGVPPLEMNTRLREAANIRARELPALFSHNRPDGRAWHTALVDVGVRPFGSGENIASGHTTPTAVVIAWMNSPAHRDNVLAWNFTQIGVGVYQDANGIVHWVQLFSA